MGWTLSTLFTGGALEAPGRRDYPELADAISDAQRECNPTVAVRPIRAWVHPTGRPKTKRPAWEYKANLTHTAVPDRR